MKDRKTKISFGVLGVRGRLSGGQFELKMGLAEVAGRYLGDNLAAEVLFSSFYFVCVRH